MILMILVCPINIELHDFKVIEYCSCILRFSSEIQGFQRVFNGNCLWMMISWFKDNLLILMMNDDWGMNNEWMILGKDNSLTLKDKWVFSQIHDWMIECYWDIPIVIYWTSWL